MYQLLKKPVHNEISCSTSLNPELTHRLITTTTTDPMDMKCFIKNVPRKAEDT
jgi:hypothetical protein